MNLLHQIADVADALTEPHINREPIPYWDANRHRKIRHHTTVQPGLLAQLHQAILPVWSTADDAGGSSVPSSRPPLAIEALSTHDEISMAVLGWCTGLGMDTRASTESNIRALVGAAGRLDTDQTKQLLGDLRRWRGWCNVYLGWEKVEHIRGVRCPLPECEQLSTLRVNLTSATAMCRACGATWGQDDGGVEVLAAHIKTSSRRVAV